MNVEEKEITTREWYDFIGNMADVISAHHLGPRSTTN